MKLEYSYKDLLTISPKQEENIKDVLDISNKMTTFTTNK